MLYLFSYNWADENIVNRHSNIMTANIYRMLILHSRNYVMLLTHIINPARQKVRELSGVHFIKALIPFMRAPPS